MPTADELGRVLPVIERLARQVSVPISVDTSKAAVARAAIDAGTEIVNDVTGLTGDAAMVPLVIETGVGVCAMHMQGTPQTMQDQPSYGNVVAEIFDYLRRRRDALVAASVALERICLDPGIGFGKNLEHNLILLNRLQDFESLDVPLMLAASRKRFIGTISGDAAPDQRLGGSLAAAIAGYVRGACIFRVHDVAETRQALAVHRAITEISV